MLKIKVDVIYKVKGHATQRAVSDTDADVCLLGKILGNTEISTILTERKCGVLTFWRRNYVFLILAHLYIKCE